MDAYVYRNSTRNATTVSSLGLMVVFLGFAYVYDAPIIIWAIWGLVALALAAMVVRNEPRGMRLDTWSFTWWTGANETSISLSKIDHVVIDGKSESSSVTLIERGGAVHTIPIQSLPKTLVLHGELLQRNVPVVMK